MIKSYCEWLNEGSKYEILSHKEDKIPILPAEIWKELGNVLVDAFSDNSINSTNLLWYVVYRTGKDYGRPDDRGMIDAVRMKSGSDGKNILTSYSPVKFTHVLGVGIKSDGENFEFFTRLCEKFAIENNLITKAVRHESPGSFMNRIFMYPEEFSGYFQGKNYGI